MFLQPVLEAVRPQVVRLPPAAAWACGEGAEQLARLMPELTDLLGPRDVGRSNPTPNVGWRTRPWPACSLG